MTKSLWRESRIAELGRVVTGTPPPSSRPECFADGDGYPFITPADMWAGRKVDEPARFLSKKGAVLLRTRLLPPGCVAVSCIGWQMGRAVMTSRPSFTNQQLNAIIPNATVDSEFLYYSLRTRQEELLSLGSATGVRTPIMNKSAFGNLTLLMPPLEVQRMIASILSAYDDLSENNLRRIKILEEMAQSLYKEWFVDFRFPGHENAKMVDSALGMIPEGWEASTVGEAAELTTRGISPRYDDEGPMTVLNQRCIRNHQVDLAESRRHSGAFPPQKQVLLGDVLINSTGVGTLGRTAQVYKQVDACVVDSHVTIVRPLSSLETDYFGMAVIELEDYFELQGKGATGQTELGRDSIRVAPFLVPPQIIQQAFSTLVQPLRRLSVVLGERTDNLRQTRDLLLPKLIYGELDVSDLNIDVGEDTA